VASEDYLEHLVHLIRAQNIGLVVPTIDTELMVFARSTATLFREGCRPLISSASFVCLAGDKWLTHQEFTARGIRCPRSWLPDGYAADELPERLFLKPRRGSSSIGAQKVSRPLLDETTARVEGPIIQEELVGDEITIDALVDLHGQPIHYVPRLRVRTLGGESIQGLTLDDTPFRDWLLTLLEVSASLGARGPITFQAFLTDQGPVLLEVNARFGGGVPLAFAAGGKYPEWILAMMNGERVAPHLGRYQRGVYMSRYSAELFSERLAW
jgi:carbamoyl-phosphate synthase large subunit